MDRTTTDTNYTADTRPPRTGAWFLCRIDGRVFYTARPDNYTRTLAHRDTYLRLHPAFTPAQVAAGLATPVLESSLRSLES